MADCSPKAATHAPHAADSASRRVISRAEDGLLAVMAAPQYATVTGSHASRGSSFIRYAHDRANVNAPTSSQSGRRGASQMTVWQTIPFDNGWATDIS
jgi:hypothetical protein